MTAGGDKINEFIAAMFALTSAIKSESERCCTICGDINEKELMILGFVGDHKSVKMSEIADHLNVPLSTLTSIADKLVAKKFLERHNSDEDRRVVKVSLGEQGQASYSAFLIRKEAVTKKVLSQFKEQEHDALIQDINRLAAAIAT